MNKKKFAKVILNKNIEPFIIYINTLLTIVIHQAIEVQITLLLAKKVKFLAEYSDFSDIILEKKALVLLEIAKLNQYTIKL